ncbi:MAG: hypothetical protein AAF629_01695 [Chloroflexota bacterium]
MQNAIPRRWSRRKLVSTVPVQPPISEYFSLIDLGADTIKVAVVGSEDGQVTVLGHSLTLSQGRDIAGGRAEAAALAAIVNGALKEAEDATEDVVGHKIVPDNVLFALPAKTVAGKRFTLRQPRSKPNDPITLRELDLLWERVMRLSRQQLPELPNVGRDWIPHTVVLTEIRLDDRLVDDPVGLSAKTITLSVYGVICQPGIMRALDQLAERLEVHIHSMVATSQAIATIVPQREALVLDIGWSGTTCYLIRDQVLIASDRNFLGGHFFTRSLAQTFKHDNEAAEALKLAYASADVLSAADTDLVTQGLQTPLKRWADLVTEIIVDMNGDAQVPGHLYFTGGGAVLPGLKAQLRQTIEQSALTFDRSPVLENLGETQLSGFRRAPTAFRGILFASMLSMAHTI